MMKSGKNINMTEAIKQIIAIIVIVGMIVVLDLCCSKPMDQVIERYHLKYSDQELESPIELDNEKHSLR